MQTAAHRRRCLESPRRDVSALRARVCCGDVVCVRRRDPRERVPVGQARLTSRAALRANAADGGRHAHRDQRLVSPNELRRVCSARGHRGLAGASARTRAPP
eukprot:Amastigsp_a509370_534.p4 type:complete len:102 gc:universal Amastigsp_a509370_534:550-855(+)